MDKNYPTAHINAAPEDFAKTVLMPGDPNRAEYIARQFLSGARLVNNVRGVQGYTGEYKGRRVSVMGSGMGIPSMAIYSHELFRFFGVENIIRIGTAGSFQPDEALGDIILAQGAATTSSYGNIFKLNGIPCAAANFELLCCAAEIARERQIEHRVGCVLSSDSFYVDEPADNERWRQLGVLGVEMESYALYMNALQAGKRALAICTVSDNLCKNEHMSATQRVESLNDMITLGLETAVRNDG